MKLTSQISIDRCPHCSVAHPQLSQLWGTTATTAYGGSNPRLWTCYSCSTCGGVVLAVAQNNGQNSQISKLWPEPQTVSDVIPLRARDFLSQAISSLHAPAGAVMLTASSIDAMLKDKGYKDGNLNSRIDAAAKDNLITKEMSAWAHEIRLDANDQRHADEDATLPSGADAEKAIEFANALAQFLYVLPSRVERGRKGA